MNNELGDIDIMFGSQKNAYPDNLGIVLGDQKHTDLSITLHPPKNQDEGTNDESERDKYSFIIETPEFQEGKNALLKKIEEMLLRFSRKVNNEPIVIDIEDLDQSSLTPNTEENLRRLKLQDQLKALELKELPELYKNEKYYSPIQFDSHYRQKNAYSCTIASTLNVLSALGSTDMPSEEEVARSIGQSGEDDPIDNSMTLSYLEKRGYRVENISSISGIIDSLEKGGVVLFTVPGNVRHRIIISGVEIKNGDIRFVVNDPLTSRSQTIPLATMISRMNYDIEIPTTQAIYK